PGFRPRHVANVLEHLPDLLRMAFDPREVAPHPVRQALRLADINDPPGRVLHEVDTRTLWKLWQDLLTNAAQVCRLLGRLAITTVLEGKQVLQRRDFVLELDPREETEQHLRRHLGVTERPVPAVEPEPEKVGDGGESLRMKSG